MGFLRPKPYKQLDRATGQWITVTPGPVLFEPSKIEGRLNERQKRPFYLQEKHANKGKA